MLYFFNIILGCFYFRFVKIDSWKELWKAIPVILLWTFIAGAQYRIGADYKMYLHYFTYPLHWHVDYEPIFKYLSQSLYFSGIKGQGPFFVYAFLTITTILIGATSAKIKNWGIFYLLLITVSVVFNNQMNAVRQCFAVGVAFWGCMEVYQEKWKAAILFVLAGLIHTSAFVCLLFCFIEPITNYTSKYPRTLLLIALAACFVTDAGVWLNNALLGLIPDKILTQTHYEYYADNDLGSDTNIIYRVSKVVLIPLYWKSIMLLKKGLLSSEQKKLYDLGMLSFCLRNVLIVNQILGRMSYYFWIPSIFPIYYLASYYWGKKQFLNFAIVMIYSSAVYVFKVIVGAKGYAHSFIYFL